MDESVDMWFAIGVIGVLLASIPLALVSSLAPTVGVAIVGDVLVGCGISVVCLRLGFRWSREERHERTRWHIREMERELDLELGPDPSHWVRK